MKKTLLTLLAATATLITTGQTNDFYDDAPTMTLAGATTITVNGEVEREMTINLTTLPVRSITVKETFLDNGKVKFTGAYRYDGYSLYDILNNVVIKKKNEASFSPIIDLYVEVTGENGEKAIFSWGEIYYPVNRHRILVATSVARIVPSKTLDLWPLPEETKIVAGNDLITARNIRKPVTVTVRSSLSNYPVNRNLEPLFSESMKICLNGKPERQLSGIPEGMQTVTYNTVFYGRGRGIHGTTPFTGTYLKELISGDVTMTTASLMNGLVIVAGKDGYRSLFTLSEIINRNDQEEILLIDNGKKEDSGRFSVFASGDFFSDRAVKAIMEINILPDGEK